MHITNGMLYTGSNQSSNSYIDKYTPSADAFSAFVESNYGIVGVQHSIPDACRTFCFSYALANLNDGEAPDTREELLNRLLEFFDMSTRVPDLAGSKESYQGSEKQFTINPFTKILDIPWPIENAIVSERDTLSQKIF